RRAVWILAWLLLILVFVAFSLGINGMEVYFLLALSGYFLSWPIHHPFSLRWKFRRMQSAFPETEVAVDENAISMKSEMMEHLIRWEKIKLVVDSPKGVLCCDQLRQGQVWFPQRAFTSTGSRAEV